MNGNGKETDKLYQCVMVFYMEQLMPVEKPPFFFGIFSAGKKNSWAEDPDSHGGMDTGALIELYVTMIFWKRTVVLACLIKQRIGECRGKQVKLT